MGGKVGDGAGVALAGAEVCLVGLAARELVEADVAVDGDGVPGDGGDVVGRPGAAAAGACGAG